MARVTGIGGVFFKARDPRALQDWYVEHLGMEPDRDGYMVIWWGGDEPGSTVWAPFKDDTDYMGPDQNRWMINYRVDDLDSLLDQLRAKGIRVEEQIMEDENGKFGWCWDLEGNKVELWEPNPGM
jgi:catechol 2,3-dioxygenase-like lactoylglutathione lyase family enzyme